MDLETGLGAVPVATCNNARLAFTGYIEKLKTKTNNKKTQKTMGILNQSLLGKPGSNINNNILPSVRVVRGEDLSSDDTDQKVNTHFSL